MARPPRIDFPDAFYPVTARGNGRARIFFTDADRSRFLDQLQDNVAAAAVLLYAFVLMENHFHLLVRTPRLHARVPSGRRWSDFGSLPGQPVCHR
jgi:REP element-mobilizing transposase RayT